VYYSIKQPKSLELEFVEIFSLEQSVVVLAVAY